MIKNRAFIEHVSTYIFTYTSKKFHRVVKKHSLRILYNNNQWHESLATEGYEKLEKEEKYRWASIQVVVSEGDCSLVRGAPRPLIGIGTCVVGARLMLLRYSFRRRSISQSSALC